MKKLFFLIPILLISQFSTQMFGQGVVVGGTAKLGGVSALGAGVAISVVTQVGSMNTAAGNGPFTTTVTGNLGVGDAAVVVCGNTFGSAYSLTISDSSSNTWTYPTSGGANPSQEYIDAGQGYTTAFATSKITTPLASGVGTITYTSGVFTAALCVILDITNPAATLLDQSLGHTATFGTSVVSGSITPSRQPEIAISAFTMSSASAAFSAYGNVIGTAASAGANYTNAAGAQLLIVEWRRITATTAGTAAATVTVNVTGITIFFTIEAN